MRVGPGRDGSRRLGALSLPARGEKGRARARRAAAAHRGGKPPPEERVEAVCSVGSFETRAQPGGFDVLYTHLSRRACLSVPYYCLWGVFSSAGFYQQSESGVFRGRIDPGQTAAIATILPQGGPADREVVWSWCVKR